MNRKISIKAILLTAAAAWLLSGLAFAAGASSAVGEKCKGCHEDLAATFSSTIHAKAGAYGIKDAGCESCHGKGDAHAKSGDKSAITNPSKLDEEAASATCLACHSKSKGQMRWRGSVHEGQKLSCVSCHSIHGGHEKLLAKKLQTEVCSTCHSNIRADMYKRSKHPLRDSSAPTGEGKMTCSSCHNAHGAKGEKLIDAKSFNDKCFECHVEKKAPMLWEHSPVKEDCMTCHNSHGSANDKLLVTKVPRLCQQCHMQGRHQTGALGTNSTYAVNRGCLNCHTMIHGSNNPSGAVLQR